MHQTNTLSEKIKLFFVLLIPILITQVGLYSMNVFDTIMSGQAGAQDLAGVAIASSLWVPIFTGMNGILLAITPIIAHLSGAGEMKKISANVKQAIYLSALLSIFVCFIGFIVLEPVLQMMKLDEKVYEIAKYYLIALGTGIFPLFIFNTLRSFIDALGKTRVSMFIILTSLPINVFLNYIFIFGKLGVPAFGGIGSGIATALTYWIEFFLILFVIQKIEPFQSFHIFKNWLKPSMMAWWEQLKIGVPIGVATFFETSIFSMVTLFMSVYSTYTIAAHQAAMNFSSLLYMIPLSVGMTLTIAVGYEVGAKRLQDARVYSYLGLSNGIFIAVFASFILIVFNKPIASMYNSHPEVLQLTTKFIYFAIFLQLADAFGAPLQGALRGYKDVNVTLILSLVSFWVIGLPSGWFLAHYTSLEPFGYWVGLIIGLTIGAIALLFRLFHIQKKFAAKKVMYEK